MAWTDDRVDMLKDLLLAPGMPSASTIAYEIGGITRSAVISKVARLGLKLPRQGSRSPTGSGSMSAKRANVRSVNPLGRKGYGGLIEAARCRAASRPVLSPVPVAPTPEPKPDPHDNTIPLGQQRTLLELTEDTCRWPIGDPASAEFFFCGGKPITGLPYCPHHSRIAYQPKRAGAE